MKKRLFSVFLSICMILTLVPSVLAVEQEGNADNPPVESSVPKETTGQTADAEPGNVAEADGVGYATLAEAVDAVLESESKNGTVTLLKDASGAGIGLYNAKGATGVTLTVDFGGFTYTCEDPAAGSTGTESQGFHLEKGNIVTLQNGTVEVASDSTNTKMVIQNYCNLTLKDLTLVGADITQYIISSNYGDITLQNVNASGTYTGSGGVIAIDLMHWLNDSYGDKAPTMTVNNTASNTITGNIDLYCYGTGSESCQSKPTLTINGGTYSKDVSNYLAEDLELIHNEDGTYTVGTLDASNSTAEVNGAYYNTLAEAISNAVAGQTVTVLKNQTLSEMQTISKGITLDLGGKTLTIAGAGTESGIYLSQGTPADLPTPVAIQNGTITDVRGKDKTALGANTIFVQGAVSLTTRNLTVQAYAPAGIDAPYYNYLLRISPDQLESGASAKVGTLTLERGTNLKELENGSAETYGAVGITAIGAYTSAAVNSMAEDYEGIKVIIKDGVSVRTTGFALNGNGANHGTTFVIEGGSLISTGSTGIYHPQQGTMSITGNPVISGYDSGIEIRAGKMTVSGGTISGLATPTAITPNGNGTTSSGAGIAVAQHTTKLPLQITINGGTINGYSAFYESNPQNNPAESLAKIDLSITGGAFNASNGGAVAVYSADKTAFISGGTYSSDPSAYVGDAKIAVAQNGMYDIQDKNTECPAEVVAGQAEADVTSIPDDKKDAVKAAVADIAATGLTGEANSEANQNTVTEETGKSALTEAGVTTADATVTIVVQPYLEVKAKAYTDTEMALDISPMVRTIATTADISDPGNIVLEDGGSKNAVQIGTAEKLGVTTNITLTVPLPAGFMVVDNTLYVEHTKDNGRAYIYRAAVASTPSGKSAAFTTTHGFSSFRLMTNDISVAEINGTYYSSLQTAIDDVENGNTIKLMKAVSDKVTVNHEVVFTIEANSHEFDPNIVTAGSGYTLSRTGNTFTVKAQSYSGGGGSGTTSYAITVNDAKNGTVKISPPRASKGTVVTITATPDKGYVLSSLTVTGKDGDKISLTDKGNGKHTFTMPASKVTVEAIFSVPFTDVSTDAYYYDAVLWAVEKGVTQGTSDTTFSPDMPCTRAQMVTFLWRAAGSPAAAGSNPFSDISSGAYYYDAVLWAVAQGITKGTSAATFSPDATVTRGQTVTFLYRANSSPAAAGHNPFADVTADAYYANAILWAVSEGVTNGTSSTTFSPDADCSRGQIVTFLYRAQV